MSVVWTFRLLSHIRIDFFFFRLNTHRYLNEQHIKKQKVSEVEIAYGNISADNQEQMEIGELGLDIWRIYMIQSLGEELVKQILDGIKSDRLNSDCSAKSIEVINGVIQSFVQVQDYRKKGNLKLYQELFETPMLEASAEYYRGLASKLLQQCSVSQYMQEVIKTLEEENRRALKFLHHRYVVWLCDTLVLLSLAGVQCM